MVDDVVGCYQCCSRLVVVVDVVVVVDAVVVVDVDWFFVVVAALK